MILPTALILLFTIFIMVTVIPYAFSSVLKQLEAVRAIEAAGMEKFKIKIPQSVICPALVCQPEACAN